MNKSVPNMACVLPSVLRMMHGIPKKTIWVAIKEVRAEETKKMLRRLR